MKHNREELLTQLNAQVVKLYQQGQFNQAVIIAEQILELAPSVYQGDHPNIATSLNNLAALYKSQGKLSQAEPLYHRTYAGTLYIVCSKPANAANCSSICASNIKFRHKNYAD